jgi:putative flippase GtrA
VIGGLLFMLDFCIVLGLVFQFNLHPFLAQFIARSFGAVVGYFLHQRFTFPIREVSTDRRLSSGLRGTTYIALTVVMITVSPAFLMFFLSVFDSWLVLAKVLTDGFTITLTFFAMKNLFRSTAK